MASWRYLSAAYVFEKDRRVIADVCLLNSCLHTLSFDADIATSLSGECSPPHAVIAGTSPARLGLFPRVQYQILFVSAQHFVCLLQKP